MSELTKKRDELQKKYDRMFAAHTTKYNKHIASEGEYRESAQKIKDLYNELSEVSQQLGQPIPIWI